MPGCPITGSAVHGTCTRKSTGVLSVSRVYNQNAVHGPCPGQNTGMSTASAVDSDIDTQVACLSCDGGMTCRSPVADGKQVVDIIDCLHIEPGLCRQGLELAVPGTYIAGEPVVTIAAFAPQLHVITSKQRPRKLTIHGSDGAEYVFLLKVSSKCWLCLGCLHCIPAAEA